MYVTSMYHSENAIVKDIIRNFKQVKKVRRNWAQQVRNVFKRFWRPGNVSKSHLCMFLNARILRIHIDTN